MKGRGIVMASLVMAAGILGSTWAAGWGAERGWWVMAGPLVMAASLGLALLVARRVGGASRAGAPAGAILAAALVLAGLLVAASDPAHLAETMPILGAATSSVLVTSCGVCCRARR